MVINELTSLWFVGALYLGKRISLGVDKFYRSGDAYVWEHEMGAVVVYDPYSLYTAFSQACNSCGMLPEDIFFGEFLGIPNALEN